MSNNTHNLPEETTQAEGVLTPKQLLFCNHYIENKFNATKAAVSAGYSEHTARSQGGRLLTNVAIRTYIDKKLAEMSLSSGETLKSISDIANGDLNPYFNVRKSTRKPKVQITLEEYIEQKEADIEDAEEVYRQGVTLGYIPATEEVQEGHEARIAARRLEVIELRIELKRNPDATRIVEGEAVLVDVAELDLARLVQEKGPRIKSIKHTEFGPSVELYPADAALRDLAKYHGLFEKDNTQKSINIHIDKDDNAL